ncbi:hypothetical protein ACHAPU_002529 [Fusarium lateritium]
MPSVPEKDSSDAEAVQAAQILLAMLSGTANQEPQCDSPDCTNKTVGNAVCCADCLARMNKKKDHWQDVNVPRTSSPANM